MNKEEFKSDEDTNSFFEQEFTEQDVLPFLLQAQDIISKLESRVVELENDLSTIHRKYEHDRNEWVVGLSQKDQFITHLTSKLQRSEFNNKEAIVLLSDLSSSAPLDDTTKSTITLTLNYLRQTEPLPNILDTQTPEEEDLEEGELERRQAAVVEWRTKNQHHHPAEEVEELISPIDELDSFSSHSSHLPEKFSAELPSTYAIHPEDHTFCTNCKQLLSQLDAQVEKHAYLKRDLNALASALAEEEDRRSMIEQDKEALEEDVGHITLSLFSILNQILMDEVTDRDGLVRLHREEGKLGQVLDAWDNRDRRLKQVKEALVQLDSVVHSSANASGAFSRRYTSQLTSPIPSGSFGSRTRFLSNKSNNSRLSIEQRPGQPNAIRIDGFVLTEFQNHLKAITDQNRLPQTPFVKTIFTDDVEPCLFFPQSQGWWRSSWFKKRLLDAILKGTCEIQLFSEYELNLTTGSSSSSAVSHISTEAMPPKTKCACCNVLRVCEFKMRLPAIPKAANKAQPWLPIDRFCRDRMVAVCDYYSFMSHLKILSSSSLLNLFKQVMHHRRKMAMARIGSIGLFEGEEEEDGRRLSSASSTQSLKRQSYQQQRRQRKNRESLVLDHSGSGSDTASVVSVSELQGLEGGQIIIVH